MSAFPSQGVWLPRGPVPTRPVPCGGLSVRLGLWGRLRLRDPAVSTKEADVLAGGGTFKETRAEVPFGSPFWPEIPWGVTSYSRNGRKSTGEGSRKALDSKGLDEILKRLFSNASLSAAGNNKAKSIQAFEQNPSSLAREWSVSSVYQAELLRYCWGPAMPGHQAGARVVWWAAMPLIPGGEEGMVGEQPGGPQPGPSLSGTAVSTSLDVDGQMVAPRRLPQHIAASGIGFPPAHPPPAHSQSPAPSLTGCRTPKESYHLSASAS